MYDLCDYEPLTNSPVIKCWLSVDWPSLSSFSTNVSVHLADFHRQPFVLGEAYPELKHHDTMIPLLCDCFYQGQTLSHGLWNTCMHAQSKHTNRSCFCQTMDQPLPLCTCPLLHNIIPGFSSIPCVSDHLQTFLQLHTSTVYMCVW